MFQNIFSFTGRIRRWEYGISLIVYLFIASLINASIADSNNDSFLGIAYIPMLWFLWAQGAKRCHDLGNSGWMQIVPFYVIWLILEGGMRGENKYGPDPKGIMQPLNTHSPQVVHTNSLVNTTIATPQPVNSTVNSSKQQVTLLEVHNVNYSLVQDILKSLRNLDEINDLSYEFLGTTATITINHQNTSQNLLEKLNSFMENIEVLGVGNGTLKIKLT